MSQNTSAEFIDITQQAIAGPLHVNEWGRYGKYTDKRFLGTKLLRMAGANIAFMELSPTQMRDRKLNPRLQFVDPHIVSITKPNDHPSVHFNRPEAEARFGIKADDTIGRELSLPIYRNPHGSWFGSLNGEQSEVLLSYLRSPILDDGSQLAQLVYIDPGTPSNRSVRQLI